MFCCGRAKNVSGLFVSSAQRKGIVINMKKRTRILALLLALMFCGGVLLSCSGGGDSGTPSQTNSEANATAVATEAATTTITCDAPKKDYGGYEFRFMGEKKLTERDYDDLYAEEYTGSAVNDAVYQRNITTEVVNVHQRDSR